MNSLRIISDNIMMYAIKLFLCLTYIGTDKLTELKCHIIFINLIILNFYVSITTPSHWTLSLTLYTLQFHPNHLQDRLHQEPKHVFDVVLFVIMIWES